MFKFIKRLFGKKSLPLKKGNVFAADRIKGLQVTKWVGHDRSWKTLWLIRHVNRRPLVNETPVTAADRYKLPSVAAGAFQDVRKPIDLSDLLPETKLSSEKEKSA